MARGIRGSARVAGTMLFGRDASPASASLRIAGALAAFTVLGSLGGCDPGGNEQSGEVAQLVWLDQGWSPQVRSFYHHQSQGTVTLPIPTSWFLALERPDGRGLFSDIAYLDTFGFIASPRDPQSNPEGLPIGLTRTVGTDPRNGGPIDRIGFTCAACHTGRIEYDDTTIAIDGGPALVNLGEFRKQLGESLKRTLRPSVFAPFADRVLGPDHSPAQGVRLHNAVARLVAQGLLSLLQNQDHGRSIEEGFGRLDALNRIGNQVFGTGMGIAANNVPITAPVAFPHIWDTSWFDWVQYNSSIEQPMVRNAGEAMGVVALVNYNDGPTPRFTSTIPIRRLHDNIESQLAGPRQPTQDNRFTGLRSPAWPEEILGPIDRELAARGAELYRELRCQGCHLPAPDTEAFWTGNHWLPANAAGERYLRLNLIPIRTIGTDPAQAEDLANRTVLVPAALGIPGGTGTGSLRRHPFGDALKHVVERVMDRWYDSQTPPTPPDERNRLNGHRPNNVRSPLAYKARPLNGIWATAPFLHNGSVPTLWALLSPYGERPTSFQLGNRRFDPVNVGYVNGGAFTLNTAIPGNRNTGHLFETAAAGAPGRPGTIGRGLSPAERRALIEYLKTL